MCWFQVDFSVEFSVWIWCIWHHCSGPELIPARNQNRATLCHPSSPSTLPWQAGKGTFWGTFRWHNGCRLKRDILGIFRWHNGCRACSHLSPGWESQSRDHQESSWAGLFFLHNLIMPLLKTPSGIVLFALSTLRGAEISFLFHACDFGEFPGGSMALQGVP